MAKTFVVEIYAIHSHNPFWIGLRGQCAYSLEHAKRFKTEAAATRAKDSIKIKSVWSHAKVAGVAEEEKGGA